MIVGIYEDKDGTRLVEVHKDKDGFVIKFPQDKDCVLTIERLEQLRSALDDVLWQKGRYTHIPDKNS